MGISYVDNTVAKQTKTVISDLSTTQNITLNEIYDQQEKIIKLIRLQLLYTREVTGLDFTQDDLDE